MSLIPACKFPSRSEGFSLQLEIIIIISIRLMIQFPVHKQNNGLIFTCNAHHTMQCHKVTIMALLDHLS